MYYKTHHDSAGRSRPYIGSRVYTAFAYLNDVEEGGETNFPTLGFKVKPRRGSLLIWPSVRNDDPTQADMRTEHGALPVEGRDTKFSANIWAYLGPFQYASELGCTASPIDLNQEKKRQHEPLTQEL